MDDEQTALVDQVVMATERLHKAGSALRVAEAEAEAARVAQSRAWTALRSYQNDLVEAKMADRVPA